MARKRHPNKHIEEALAYAEAKQWRVVLNSRGHAWARIYCPHADRTGCVVSVYSTPRVPENHAKTLVKLVNKCTCKGG